MRRPVVQLPAIRDGRYPTEWVTSGCRVIQEAIHNDQPRACKRELLSLLPWQGERHVTFRQIRPQVGLHADRARVSAPWGDAR